MVTAHNIKLANYDAHAADRSKSFGNSREVSKADFFAYMNNLNVHPEPQPLWSVWKNLNKGQAVEGYSEPGYQSPYGTPPRYFLR